MSFRVQKHWLTVGMVQCWGVGSWRLSELQDSGLVRSDPRHLPLIRLKNPVQAEEHVLQTSGEKQDLNLKLQTLNSVSLASNCAGPPDPRKYRRHDALGGGLPRKRRKFGKNFRHWIH